MSGSSSDEFEFEGSPPHQVNEEKLKEMSTDVDGDSSKTLANDGDTKTTTTSAISKPASKEKKAAPQKGKGKTSKPKATKKATANKKPKPTSKTKKPAQKTKTKKNTNTKSNSGKASAKGKAATNNSCTKTPAKGKGTKTEASESAAMDLFSKHYREFERCLVRLEKVDQFGYFWDDAPEKFVEDYSIKKPSTEEKEKEQGNSDNKEASNNSNIYDGGDDDDPNRTNKSQAPGEYPEHPPFNWEMVRRRRDQGRYVLDIKRQREQQHQQISNWLQDERNKDAAIPCPDIQYAKGVDWDLFKADVAGMCSSSAERHADDEDDDGKSGSRSYAIKKIIGVLEQIYERTGCRQMNDLEAANNRDQFTGALERTTNTEAAFQGKWRKIPFPERQYERLPTRNVVCAGLSELDERIASYELRTTLPDSFVGISYKYEDDTGKSEAWMKSVLSETSGGKKKAQEAAIALAEDEGVIRAQVTTCMEMLLVAVQDRCLTEADVLHQPELRSANWEAGNSETLPVEVKDKEAAAESSPHIVEQPVWGIDCYTRRNVSICLSTEFDQETALVFIEKWLLPAINACPVDLASEIANAALILEGLPFTSTNLHQTDKSNNTMTATEERWSHSLIGMALKKKIETGPPWLKLAARLLRRARETMGPDFFRVHPKGHGSVVLSPLIKPNTLVTFYRGEVYPSWRWGEKMDAIDITQARKKLRPALPDFYNMALERPQKDPRKYGLLFIDASRKAGHGSSVSHSCAPTCEVRVAAVNGELCLAMTTLREIEMGEELTFDYNAVTESLVEYRSAVCLCGYGKCRGSFLHFATADCYQRVLDRNAPIAVRFASLAKGCMKEVMSDEDDKTLRNHGFLTAAFGAISVNRHKASGLQNNDDLLLDSMDNVPVWLRTYVADTLRYIEYERRALPISLICEDLSKSQVDSTCTTLEVNQEEAASKDDCFDRGDSAVDATKRAKGEKKPMPMPTFFFYCRVNDARFREILKAEEGLEEKDFRGLEFTRAIKRVAGIHWKRLSPDEKAAWKQKAEKDFEKQNSRPKASLEKKRKQPAVVEKSKAKAKKSRGKEESLESKFESSNVSFQNADAEGASAMEQRIQQLAQSLSRVGRVLDRHREAVHVANKCGPEASSETLRSQVHPPLTVATDEQIVAWLWNSDGLVPTLLAKIESEECVSPTLKSACRDIKKKYAVLDKFGNHWSLPEDYRDFPIKPRKARKKVANALMEFRKAILRDLRGMAKDFKKQKQREKAERKIRLLDESTSGQAAETPCAIESELLSGKLSDVSQEHDEPGSTTDISGGQNDRLDGVETPKKPVNDFVAENGNQQSCIDQPKTVACQDVGSCDSMATPSLLSEETKLGVGENPAIISREVSSEVEGAAGEGHCMKSPNAKQNAPSRRSMEVVASAVCVRSPARTISEGAEGNVNATSCDISHPCDTFDDVDQTKNSASSEANDVVAAISQTSNGKANEAMAVEGGEQTNSPDRSGTAIEDAEAEVSSVLRDLVDAVVARVGTGDRTSNGDTVGENSHTDDDDKPKPWLKHYAQRYKLQATADLLLLYAKTSTFFLMQPYKPLRSTPIEVYARELGNAVPRSVIDKSIRSHAVAANKLDASQRDSMDAVRNDSKEEHPKVQSQHRGAEITDEDLCEPDEVVAEVTVKYQGDFIIAQLLNWFNAGIGQAPGMPQTLGCIHLPPISGCWAQKSGSVPKSKVERPTSYESKTRPSLVNWFSDPQKRGSPWPDELKAAFSYKGSADLPSDTSRHFVPLGSPVLDLLVTGDDSSILSILDEFGVDEAKKRESGLLSTLDEGRPAQAVSNWVQCENPNCLKWRRIPWHVDIDVLAQRFVCSDNKWNKASRSCDAPEDDYDEADNDVVGSFSPGKKPIPEKKVASVGPTFAKKVLESPPVDEKLIVAGARFDVLRKGKTNFCVGVVVEVAAGDDGPKKAKFHFPKLQSKHDEYIEFGPRIAPLYSKVSKPEKRKRLDPKEGSKHPRAEVSSKPSVQKTLFLAKEATETMSSIAGSGASTCTPATLASESCGSVHRSELIPPEAKDADRHQQLGSPLARPTPTTSRKACQPEYAALSLAGTVSSTGANKVNQEVSADSSLTGSTRTAEAPSCLHPPEVQPLHCSSLVNGSSSKPEPVQNSATHSVDAEFIKKLKLKMERKEKKKEEKARKDKKAKKRKHGEPLVSNSGTCAEQLQAAVGGTERAKHSLLEEGEVEEGEFLSPVKRGRVTNAESVSAAAAPNNSQHPLAQIPGQKPAAIQHTVTEHPTASMQQLQAAAAIVGTEALGALASLMSMRVPRKSRGSVEQPSSQSFTSGGGIVEERSDLPGSNQFARAPSSSSGTYAVSQSQYRQPQYHIPQQLEPNPRLATAQKQQRVSQIYAAMDNQDQLQRMQQVQNAVNVEIQRQRLQQVQNAVHAEIQRHSTRLPFYTDMERGDSSFLQAASRSLPHQGARQSHPNNYPEYAADFRFGGFPYRDHRYDRR